MVHFIVCNGAGYGIGSHHTNYGQDSRRFRVYAQAKITGLVYTYIKYVLNLMDLPASKIYDIES